MDNETRQSMTEPKSPRFKDTLISQIRDVDWTRSMSRIILTSMIVIVILLVAFQWAMVVIHGPDRGWLASIAVMELIPYIDVPVEGSAL